MTTNRTADHAPTTPAPTYDRARTFRTYPADETGAQLSEELVDGRWEGFWTFRDDVTPDSATYRAGDDDTTGGVR